eukprot:scaffold24027_cov86-Cyclotella_meneghiniana.AAC.2
MDKTDNTILTNQPETGAIPPLVSSRVVGCLGVVEKAVRDGRIRDIRLRPSGVMNALHRRIPTSTVTQTDPRLPPHSRTYPPSQCNI